MQDYKDMYASIEAFEADVNLFTVQTVALEAIDAHGYSPQLDTMLVRLGLESSTALYDSVTVSQEGAVDWLKVKVKSLTDKAQILANKLIGKITGRQEEIAALLARKEAGEDVKLPVSKGVALAGIAVITAATAAITYLGASLGKKKFTERKEAAHREAVRDKLVSKKQSPGKPHEGPAKEEEPGLAARAGAAIKGAKDGVMNHARSVRDRFSKAEKATVPEAVEEIKEASAKVEEAVKKADAAPSTEEKVDVGFFKSILSKLSGAFDGLKNAIKGFLGRVSAQANGAGQENKTIMERLRFAARFVAAAFRITVTAIGKGFSKVWSAVSSFRKKSTDGAAAKTKPEKEAAKPAAEGFGRL